ncbi:acyltransferase [Corynebacterium sp.]|uniref:acyltransferase family protein n=1 Tax=Corynebacterium sp. TaxID=1720 RepID=UPI0026DCA985|nr:acyltransferase [Corynebacterium sp.]MDO5076744.1 acyltransferase [Corynebacterium sp.]
MRVPQSYNPQLQALRAVAAIGIVFTHAAFQTAAPARILERFDFFVPVFFALSAFLLWRPPSPGYYRRRALRILPAYLALVFLVFLVIPEAYGASMVTIVANFTFTQIYVPHALHPGLTHLWSLCVEVAFYLALPLLYRLGWQKVLALSLLSFGWAWLPFVQAVEVVNLQIWPPAFLPWFCVGILAAEYHQRRQLPARVKRIFHIRSLWWAVAALAMWVAAQPWYGPPGLIHPTPTQFALRVLAGTVFAASVVVPYALAPGWWVPKALERLGLWSYSFFLWHLAVLSVSFPILGIRHFDGNFWPVVLLTIALTIPVSAASYLLIEQPGSKLRLPTTLWARLRPEPVTSGTT